jgi:raffinose/stachyose/melibiose transport system permease protein
VRLNLILMCVNTLKAWGLVFILVGDSGGPAGKLMVPGLYMFRKAFAEENQAGYACAIGLLLFFVILVLTLINNRYVRVRK